MPKPVIPALSVEEQHSPGRRATIPQMAPLAFDQVIIAGGDEDMTAADLFDWVVPLLAGIPGGRWMSCQIDFAADGHVEATYCEGNHGKLVNIRLDADAPLTRDLVGLLPEADSLVVILLSDCSSQAVTLLDGVARWLNIYDTDEDSLAPVVRLLGGFQTILSKA